MLAKCQVSLTRLENFRGELKTAAIAKSRYKVVSIFNQNVATYARYSVFGFFSFVECFVNSIGEDFIARNPKLAADKCELLRGKKDGRYLAVEKKLEVFPGIIRADGKRPIVLSDPKQITEPYKTFVSHVKDVRDSSAHFSKYKADSVGRQQLPQPHEGAHDLDVDLNGTGAVQNAGKHGDTLFGEGVGRRANTAPT